MEELFAHKLLFKKTMPSTGQSQICIHKYHIYHRVILLLLVCSIQDPLPELAVHILIKLPRSPLESSVHDWLTRWSERRTIRSKIRNRVCSQTQDKPSERETNYAKRRRAKTAILGAVIRTSVLHCASYSWLISRTCASSRCCLRTNTRLWPGLSNSSFSHNRRWRDMYGDGRSHERSFKGSCNQCSINH